MLKSILVILASILLLSCNVEPQPIIYGKDQCNFCKMNIVDNQHAAQYVTNKGKQFKFDAIECMINQLEEIDASTVKTMLVSNYGKSEMTDATSATYLISQQIKSPMGAYLSAFSDHSVALSTQKEFTGDLYNWDKVKIQLARK